MRKVFLMFSLLVFIGSTTFGSTVKLSEGVCISVDCEKCGKADCKSKCSGDKAACKKKGEKCCKGDAASADGEKKACCKKGNEKACCKKSGKEKSTEEEAPATPEKQ